MAGSELKAIFVKDFQFDRRPRQAVAFDIKAGPDVKTFPRDVIEAAKKAGAAVDPARSAATSKKRESDNDAGSDAEI